MMNLLAQGLSLYILYGYEVMVVQFANLVDVRDVRVIERGYGVSLLLEASQALLVLAVLRRKKLEGYGASQWSVLSEETSLIPPEPSLERISYRPRRMPGDNVMAIRERNLLG